MYDDDEMYEEEIEDEVYSEADNSVNDVLELLQQRVGQSLTLGELNTVLQSIFGMYNEVFITYTDIYNIITYNDSYGEITVQDEEYLYIITYTVVYKETEEDPLIKIIDVDIE